MLTGAWSLGVPGEQVLERAVPDEASGGAAAASAWLIDTLAAMLHQRTLLGHPEGHPVAFCLRAPALNYSPIDQELLVATPVATRRSYYL